MSAGPQRTRTRVIVRGLVQGVCFRWNTRDMAERLGLDGWVRNLPDGQRVEAVFEGDPALVAEAVALTREGPAGSRVDTCEEFPEAPEGLSGFEIRH